MDSGFCELVGLIGIFERGLYGSALVKKRRYWPKLIHLYGINNHYDQMFLIMTSSQEIWSA